MLKIKSDHGKYVMGGWCRRQDNVGLKMMALTSWEENWVCDEKPEEIQEKPEQERQQEQKTLPEK